MTAALSSSSSSTTLLDEFHSSKSPLSPALLHSLLQRLLTHPRIHNGFVDILQLPSVHSTLENMDPAKRDSLVTTVKLFAFGTIQEYQELKEKNQVWTLSDAQLDKLRMLSVVNVARRGQIKSSSREKTDVEMMPSDHAASVQNYSSLSIPYAHLATELQIIPAGTSFSEKDHLRQLEDVLIQCVYSNIIVGKLDQASQAFVVESHVALQEQQQQQQPSPSSLGMKKKEDSTTTSITVHGSLLSRDIDTITAASTKTEVKRMISTLEQFLSSSNKLLSSLEHISNVSASVRKEDEKRWRNVEKKLSEEGSDGSSRFRAPGGDCDIIFEGGGSDPMEVVDMSGRRKVKRSRGGHNMGGRF